MKFKLLATLVALMPAVALAQMSQPIPPASPGTQQNQMISQEQSANQSRNVGGEESKRVYSSSSSTYKTVEICTDGKCITVSCSSADIQTNHCD